jgi:hypothetical protein
MAEEDPESIVRSASDLISEEGSFAAFLQNTVIGGIILGITYQIIGTTQSIGSTLIAPFRAFGQGMAAFVEATFGGPVRLLEASVMTGVDSIRRGLVSEFGILAYPLTMIVIMIALYIFGEGVRRLDLSPWNFFRNLRR